MPTERLSMRRIRDLLRLTFENGLSNRQVAASLGLSKGAVGMYLRRARTAGVAWPLPEELTDTALERLLFPGAPQDHLVVQRGLEMAHGWRARFLRRGLRRGWRPMSLQGSLRGNPITSRKR